MGLGKTFQALTAAYYYRDGTPSFFSSSYLPLRMPRFCLSFSSTSGFLPFPLTLFPDPTSSEWPVLVVVPSSLRCQWAEIFEDWIPDLAYGDVRLLKKFTVFPSSLFPFPALCLPPFLVLSHLSKVVMIESAKKLNFGMVNIVSYNIATRIVAELQQQGNLPSFLPFSCCFPPLSLSSLQFPF
jgi:SNF2 family DNA or RNA helicase